MDYVWSMLEDGYYKHGIRSFWLDASEPEYYEIPQWVSATNSPSCRHSAVPAMATLIRDLETDCREARFKARLTL